MAGSVGNADAKKSRGWHLQTQLLLVITAAVPQRSGDKRYWLAHRTACASTGAPLPALATRTSAQEMLQCK